GLLLPQHNLGIQFACERHICRGSIPSILAWCGDLLPQSPVLHSAPVPKPREMPPSEFRGVCKFPSGQWRERVDLGYPEERSPGDSDMPQKCHAFRAERSAPHISTSECDGSQRAGLKLN